MPIEVIMTFDLATMRSAHEWHWRKYGVVTWIWPALGIVLLITGIFLVTRPSGRAVFGGYCIICGVYCLLRKKFARFRQSRAIMKSNSFGKRLTWQISERGVAADTEGLSLRADWDNFVETISTPEGLLLYPDRQVYYWLPRIAFTSEEDYQQTVQLAASHTRHRVLS